MAVKIILLALIWTAPVLWMVGREAVAGTVWRIRERRITVRYERNGCRY